MGKLLRICRQARTTQGRSSAEWDVYKSQNHSDDNFGCELDKEELGQSSSQTSSFRAQTEGDLAFVRKEMNQICSVLLSRKKRQLQLTTCFHCPMQTSEGRTKGFSQWGLQKRGERQTSHFEFAFRFRSSHFEVRIRNALVMFNA